MSLSLLLVEDDKDQRSILQSMLTAAGYHVTAQASVSEGMQQLQLTTFDIVLSDWKVGNEDGLQLLEQIRQSGADAAFILMTAYGNLANAVATIRAGADDYLSKPFEKNQLLFTLARVATLRALRDENRQLRHQIQARDQLVDLIGHSSAMQNVFRRIEKLAPTQATVLIYGESGTGKELAARALHKLSNRNTAPFVALNCAAVPESLFEAELFGAEKGAYTGADRLKIGRAEAAEGGTLFLDEIGELPLTLQPKLLRLLQENSYQRLGSHRDLRANIRIVAATNRDLQQEVDAGRFRADLFYRLHVVPVRLPALRERREDIAVLARHFVHTACERHGLPTKSIAPSAMEQLTRRYWHGNVRELAHAMERYVLLGEGHCITPSDIDDEATSTSSAPSPVFRLPSEGLDWDEHERDLLQQALQLAQYNRTQAARLLNLPYKAFLYRLEKFNLIPPKQGD